MNNKMMTGAITIGQSPRTDVIPEIKSILGEKIEIIECGALDDLSQEEIRHLESNCKGDILITRLRDGTQVKVGEDDIIPRVEACIRKLEKQTPVILLICTGTFPEFKSKSLILYPERVLYNMVKSVLHKGKLGIMAPGVEQITYMQNRWRKIIPDVTVVSASPYIKNGEEIKLAAEQLNNERMDLIVMDCIGYTLGMKEWVKGITGRPVLLARSALARIAAELLL